MSEVQGNTRYYSKDNHNNHVLSPVETPRNHHESTPSENINLGNTTYYQPQNNQNKISTPSELAPVESASTSATEAASTSLPKSNKPHGTITVSPNVVSKTANPVATSPQKAIKEPVPAAIADKHKNQVALKTNPTSTDPYTAPKNPPKYEAQNNGPGIGEKSAACCGCLAEGICGVLTCLVSCVVGIICCPCNCLCGHRQYQSNQYVQSSVTTSQSVTVGGITDTVRTTYYY